MSLKLAAFGFSSNKKAAALPPLFLLYKLLKLRGGLYA